MLADSFKDGVNRMKQQKEMQDKVRKQQNEK